MSLDDLLLVAGSASQRLTAKVAAALGIAPAKSDVLRFPEGNLFVRLGQNVRGRHVFVVQSVAFPANDHFMELLFWIDAAKRASAASVTAVVPYFSYAKGDKKDEPRVSIRARVCADAMEAAGVDRVLTMDLHAPQIQGFFKVAVDDLYGLLVLADQAKGLGLTSPVVVAPDAGFVKKARLYARRLNAPLVIADKERTDHAGSMVIREIIGEVAGRQALIVDDFSISGGTLVNVAQKLKDLGAVEVWAAVTHGLFTQDAMHRLDASPIRRLLVTDSIETQAIQRSPKLEVVSVAPLFAEAVRRIHERESLSGLFD
jgi:ribose-phosphate pyrophosphokinase